MKNIPDALPNKSAKKSRMSPDLPSIFVCKYSVRKPKKAQYKIIMTHVFILFP